MTHLYLNETPLLDFRANTIQSLVATRGWSDLTAYDKIGAAYDYVRDDIQFGYNADDALPASRILADGYGQCNTKATLLMALLRAVGISCRLHGFTIDKGLQRGVVPELVYPLAPRNILHSWVEVQYEGAWVDLEGFILDQGILRSLQTHFQGRKNLCAYGAGTSNLTAPDVTWRGESTYIQRSGINHDFGVFDAPDAFYQTHRQLLGMRGFIYRRVIRHWMNRRVANIRAGRVPIIPGGEKNLLPQLPTETIS